MGNRRAEPSGPVSCIAALVFCTFALAGTANTGLSASRTPMNAAGRNEELVRAAARGDTASVRSLLAAGADVDGLGDTGETALMLARKGGHDETVAMLRDAGARELFFAQIQEQAEGPDGVPAEPPGPGSPQGYARRLPERRAVEVEDAFAPYRPDRWIVSPVEEPEGDIPADTVPAECDIRGVLSCFDASHLRVDILSHHDITGDKSVGFGVKLSYAGNVSEYFTYFTGMDRLYYVREISGLIEKSHRLTGSESADSAGFSGRNAYILIEKDAHVGGVKGRPYRVEAVFYSMTLDGQGVGRIEDRTIRVDLRYVR